ncbi:MAG: metallophosphoesterase [Candidatus Omnitrophica bacterium]|nr:metallophosphoesterase [Candidatus Omnitrophota bacterium]
MLRRTFLRDGTLILGTLPLIGGGSEGATVAVNDSNKEGSPRLRIGLVTDLHYADKDPGGTRFYRESIAKFEECIRKFNDEKLDLTIELGDFVDAAEEVETEIGYLETIDKIYSKFSGDRHYVLGNHCVWTLTKEQFRDHSGARATHYSFDRNGVHIVILDACYRADGVPYGNRNYEWTDTEIPALEREWLEEDLSKTDLPTITFTHQRIDVSNNFGIKSGPEVRKILEDSGKVLAVFQGHNHINEHKEIGGIHYVTLAALIEGSGKQNNAYSILDVYPDRLEVSGFRNQVDYSL